MDSFSRIPAEHYLIWSNRMRHGWMLVTRRDTLEEARAYVDEESREGEGWYIQFVVSPAFVINPAPAAKESK